MAESRRKALVVVTSTYGDGKLTALRAPPQDAAALAEVLGDPAVGGFDVETLADPSCQKLREEVEEFFADRTSDHTLLLHFSCHGVKDAAGTLFLATTDTRCVRLASTAVPAEYVSSLMLASQARRAVVILDCCYAGAFERGLLTRSDTDAHMEESFQNLNQISDTSQRGRAVLAACGAVEFARDGVHDEATEPLQPSFFTRTVVKGLRSGDADLDGNGEIGVSELHQYVCDELRELTPHQTPRLWVFGAHGRDLPVARAPAKRAGPTPLPERVAALVHSGSPAERLWAVDDLESILHGSEIGLALTALTTLDELVRDDSRRVADRAERARRSVRPRVEPEVLDLGIVTPESLGPSAVITIEGPPVVRSAVEATTDSSWLKTEHVAGRGEVRVGTTQLPGPGNHKGKVLVHTALGDASVQVVVEVRTRVGTEKNQVGAEKTKVDTGETEPRDPPPAWHQPPRHPKVTRAMTYWPFFCAAALLTVAFISLLVAKDPGFYLWGAFQGGSGLLVWPGLLLSLVANTVLTIRARSPVVLRYPPTSVFCSYAPPASVFWSYASLTALNILGTGVAAVAYDLDYAKSLVAVLLLACACVAELAGCLVLWKARPPVTQGTSGPPSGT